MMSSGQLNCMPSAALVGTQPTDATCSPQSLPNQPTGLTATLVAEDEDDLAWTGHGGENAFFIYTADGLGNHQYLGSVAAGVFTYTVSVSNPFLTVIYDLAAWNSCGSRWADIGYMRMGKGQITSATQDAPGSDLVNLSWAAIPLANYNGGYIVEYSADGTTWDGLVYTGFALSASNYATGAALGTTAYFRVRAAGPSGMPGPWSEVVSVPLSYAAPVVTAFDQDSTPSTSVTVTYTSGGPGAFEVQGRLNGGAWATVYTGDETFANWNTAGGNGDVVGVRVRDGGAFGTWSAISSLTLA